MIPEFRNLLVLLQHYVVRACLTHGVVWVRSHRLYGFQHDWPPDAVARRSAMDDGLDVVFKNSVLEETVTPDIQFFGHQHDANGMLLEVCLKLA